MHITKFLGGFVAGTLSSIVAFGSYKFLFEEKTENLDHIAEKGPNLHHQDILKYGTPNRGPYVRYYSNHVLSYDQVHKTPSWVVEKITEDNTKGNANRRHSKFKPDPDVDKPFSATNSDYWNSGWSRGHMAPAGDNKHDQNAMDETFYLSNVVPQNIDNNAGFWNRLEIYCRKLTKKYKNVRIYSGPLVIPQENKEDGKRYVTYQVIGQNEVAVPTHLYKIIIVEDSADNPVGMGSFIVPNKPISHDQPLKEFQVPLPDLEKRAGVRFTPNLDSSRVPDLCSVESCELMSKKEFELYFIGRRIDNATNLNQLEKAWNEISQRRLEPDEYIKRKYKEKYEKFMKSEEHGG